MKFPHTIEKGKNLIRVYKNAADDEISSFCSDLHQLRGPAGGWVGECGAPAGVGPAAKIIQNPHFALAAICVSCPHCCNSQNPQFVSLVLIHGHNVLCF